VTVVSNGARVLIDGIVIPKLNEATFLDMKRGGLTAATYMASIWDEPAQALHNLAAARAAIRSSDHAILVRTVDDIQQARTAGAVGVIIGWQNSDGFGQNVECVPLFQELGLRVVSISFNYANAAGSGCYEPSDGGLTALGREIVEACNDAGILIDLTHVGDRTGADIIGYSKKPVCYTHAGARALMADARNKTDEQFKAIAECGGVAGIAALPHFLPRRLDSTVQDYVRVVEHVFNIVGEDHIAIGTDLVPGQDRGFSEYTARRKGFGALAIDYSTPPVLAGLSNFGDYHGMVDLLPSFLTDRQIEKFLGLNWLRVYRETW
jgi:membrane dipeptidase